MKDKRTWTSAWKVSHAEVEQALFAEDKVEGLWKSSDEQAEMFREARE